MWCYMPEHLCFGCCNAFEVNSRLTLFSPSRAGLMAFQLSPPHPTGSSGRVCTVTDGHVTSGPLPPGFGRCLFIFSSSSVHCVPLANLAMSSKSEERCLLRAIVQRNVIGLIDSVLANLSDCPCSHSCINYSPEVCTCTWPLD